MKILVTGGTGFLGTSLVKRLQQQGNEVTVVSRSPAKVKEKFGLSANPLQSVSDIKHDDSYEIVINLAGEPIAEGRWNENRKRTIRQSRIDLTKELVSRIEKMTMKPKLLISGSAVGFYGDQGDKILTEKSDPRDEFAHRLCAEWEFAAKGVESFGVRVCLIRTCLVIGGNGGFLQRMILPFRLGLGGRLGNGAQWMSWIHLNDWLRIAEAMIADESMRDVYNATAPNPVTNQEFTQILASCLKKPALLPVPEWFLKIMFGEMSQLLLGSQRVVPERLLNAGFSFDFCHLKEALADVLTAT